MRMETDSEHVREALQRATVLVDVVRHERVERVPQPTLPDHLERRAAHPAQHVDLACLFADARGDRAAELQI